MIPIYKFIENEIYVFTMDLEKFNSNKKNDLNKQQEDLDSEESINE